MVCDFLLKIVCILLAFPLLGGLSSFGECVSFVGGCLYAVISCKSLYVYMS